MQIQVDSETLIDTHFVLFSFSPSLIRIAWQYWTSTVGACRVGEGALSHWHAMVDLWDTASPSRQNGTSSCGRVDQHVDDAAMAGCSTCYTTPKSPLGFIEYGPFNGSTYEDDLFTERMLSIIEDHDVNTPLFFFWAPHSIHIPLQVNETYKDAFAFIDDRYRQVYHAMVKHLDDDVGQLVAKLEMKNMWDNTLIAMSSDNGGPVM